AADVRSEHAIFAGQQRGRNFGLEFKDIERGASDFSGIERFNQRGFVHNRAARSVHEIGALLHAPESLSAEKMASGGKQWNMQADEIGFEQNAVEADEFGCHLRFDFRGDAHRIVIERAHAEAFGAAGHFAADAPEADDAESFAPYVGAAKLIEIPAGPGA